MMILRPPFVYKVRLDPLKDRWTKHSTTYFDTVSINLLTCSKKLRWTSLHVKKISRTRNATICSSLRCTSLELQEEVVTRVVKRPPSSLSEFSISDADDYYLDCRERRDRAEMTARGHQKQSVRTMAWSPKNLNISTPHWTSYVLVTFEYSHFLSRWLIFNQNSALPLPPTMYIHSIARMYHYPTSENVYKDIVDLLIHK